MRGETHRRGYDSQDSLEEEERPDREETREDNGHNPVDGAYARPPKSEQADRYTPAPDHGGDEAVLGVDGSALALKEPLERVVRVHAEAEVRQERADEQAHKREALFAAVEAVYVLEDKREGGEECVQKAVYEADVEVEEADDGFRVEDERAHERHHRDLAPGHASLHNLAHTVEVRVACASSKALRAPVENVRGGRLGHEEGEPDERCGGQEEKWPDGPAPAQRIEREAGTVGQLMPYVEL